MKAFVTILKFLKPVGGLLARLVGFVFSDVRILLVTLLIVCLAVVGFQRRQIKKQGVITLELKNEVSMYESQVIELQKLIKPLRDDKIRYRVELERMQELHRLTTDTLGVERNNVGFYKERVEGVQVVLRNLIDSLRTKEAIIKHKDKLIVKYQKRCK